MLVHGQPAQRFKTSTTSAPTMVTSNCPINFIYNLFHSMGMSEIVNEVFPRKFQNFPIQNFTLIRPL
ncbi:hypothetical protein SAMN04490182_2839 [Pseudomonas cedrina]|uniref:Uncharacterized protein n=1 Tax=Pseudomonas cedrina TaxID=651740 RepID=A0ABY0UNC8_PSECE|nr:hypothetical protein SAMN04490182_2839 [Pseudomonas cedrina]